MLDRDAITYALVTGDVELAKDSVAFLFCGADLHRLYCAEEASGIKRYAERKVLQSWRIDRSVFLPRERHLHKLPEPCTLAPRTYVGTTAGRSSSNSALVGDINLIASNGGYPKGRTRLARESNLPNLGSHPFSLSVIATTCR
jgi:hypothetical protein